MSDLQSMAAAVQRVQAVLQRRPDTGILDDAPAMARWDGGARCTTSHANGTSLSTDMPTELGGGGTQVTPGWMFRAALASCAATSIALAAAAQQVELEALDVRASSRSDTRGLLGMAGADGVAVYGGPFDVQLHVRISARACPAEKLQALVHEAIGRSPIPSVVQTATALAVRVDVAEPAAAPAAH